MRIFAASIVRRELLDRRRAGFALDPPEKRRPEWRRNRRLAAKLDIGVDLALKQLPHQHKLAVLDVVADHVAHQHLAKRVASFGAKSRT